MTVPATSTLSSLPPFPPLPLSLLTIFLVIALGLGHGGKRALSHFLRHPSTGGRRRGLADGDTREGLKEGEEEGGGGEGG